MRLRYCEVSCDTCADNYVGPYRTLREAVRQAKELGWVLAKEEDGGDLCPDCQQAIDSVQAAL